MSELNTNKVLFGVFWVYLENSTRQLISFVVTIVLARLLEPSHYGVIALLTVYIALAEVFVTSGISSALIQKKDADDLDYCTMFWFNLLVSLILYFILFFSAPYIGEYYHQPSLALVLRVLALSIPMSAYNCIQQAYVSSHMIFKKSFISSSSGGVISGVIGILMAYLGCGLWALVAQRLLNIAFSTILLKFIVKWTPKAIFSFKRLKPMLSFGWRMVATGFLLTGYTQLRSLIIGKKYSTEELGYYDRGFAFPTIIASNIDATITKVLFPALAQSKGGKFMAEKSRRAAKTSAFIMTPVLWGLAVISNSVVNLLLGEKWLPCVTYLQIMCFVWWLQPTQTCSAQAIKALGRSDTFLYIEIISKALGLALLAVAILVFNSVLAIAVMYFVGQVFAVFIYGISSQIYVGYKFKYQLYDLFIPSMLSLVMCIIMLSVPFFISNTIICMLLQILIGIIVYWGMSVVTKNEAYYYILNSFKRSFSNKD